MLARLPKPEGAEHSPVRIGIATYDRAIHFYNLHVCQCGEVERRWATQELWQIRLASPSFAGAVSNWLTSLCAAQGSLSQPQELIVCDTEDPFVPLGENGLTVDVNESKYGALCH
jgi:hypothetical protein